MRKGKRLLLSVPILGFACAIGLAGRTQGAISFAGNGATGFGGTLGNGNLVVSDSPTAGSVTFTLNPTGTFTSASGNNNAVVVYLDSTTGGFTSTSSFSDNGDGGREAISAENSGNPSRDTISFPTGFAADYAIIFENSTFTGLFQLAAGGNGSLTYVNPTASSDGGTNGYYITIPDSAIGITPGQSVSFDADLISNTAYGSNESIGTSVVTPDPAGSGVNAGFNGSLSFSSADTYTTSPVPEPVGLALVGVSGISLMLRRRRQVV